MEEEGEIGERGGEGEGKGPDCLLCFCFGLVWGWLVFFFSLSSNSPYLRSCRSRETTEKKEKENKKGVREEWGGGRERKRKPLNKKGTQNSQNNMKRLNKK